MSTSKSLRAGIVGFRGYSGQELLQIMRRHRYVEGVALEH
ncbi:MAG: N-acetyl-gamma-glutamyl-phosphate reductase, partial [Acidobacteriota bacterium]